jgi:hypothetical protein
MSEQKAQDFWVPVRATIRLSPPMRLARAERERLWKGLERFVNCGESLHDYEALGRGAFRDFWPVEITDLGSGTGSLNWHPRCHKLFLVYRDILREVWRGERLTMVDSDPLGSRGHYKCEFLLGLTGYNEKAREEVSSPLFPSFPLSMSMPFQLISAWREIIEEFPTASVEGRVELHMLWGMGDFTLVPHNDFQRGFYLLFRQSWRARACPRCNVFFVAHKPKQIFCGTGCSAGSRLASKLKWWNRTGAKRRASQGERAKRGRTERKHR